MRSKSKSILKLLTDKGQLKEARQKMLRISREIQGFGNQVVVSPISSCSSRTSRSSFGSYSSGSPILGDLHESLFMHEEHYDYSTDAISNNLHKRSPRSNSTPTYKEAEGIHLWDSPIDEDSTLIESKIEEKEGFVDWSSRFYSRIFGSSHRAKRDNKLTITTLSDLNRTPQKKMERHSSILITDNSYNPQGTLF